MELGVSKGANKQQYVSSLDVDRWSFRMESEEGRRGGELSDNPLLVHLVFVRMEDLADRLKLLDYETRFCKQHKFKPFSRQGNSVSDQSNEYDLTNQNAVQALNEILLKRKQHDIKPGASTI